MFKKVDEIPFDFSRKRLTIIVKRQPQTLIVSSSMTEIVVTEEMEEITSVGEMLQISSDPDAPNLMITKGAFHKVIDVCTHVLLPKEGGEISIEPLTHEIREGIDRIFEDWSGKGFRVLGIAQKEVPPKEQYALSEEKEFVFCGMLTFYDPPKPVSIRYPPPSPPFPPSLLKLFSIIHT